MRDAGAPILAMIWGGFIGLSIGIIGVFIGIVFAFSSSASFLILVGCDAIGSFVCFVMALIWNAIADKKNSQSNNTEETKELKK